MTGPEDGRPPLDEAVVEQAARAVGWRVEVTDAVESTNAAVAERFRNGERHGLVLATEHQTAGRGRLGRGWVTPARTSVTASFLLVPEQEGPEWSWLPLLTGIAAARAVDAVTRLRSELKWPNDVLLEGRKLGGILLERVATDGNPAAVVGIGLNVSQAAEELPVQEATSLALAGAGTVERSALLAALITELAAVYDDWRAGDDLGADYRRRCATLGRRVRVLLPVGELEGTAVDVDEHGRLVVETAEGEEHLAAGDVVHVRGAAPMA